MSSAFDYNLSLVRVGRDGRTAGEVSYKALPMQVRTELERGWRDAHGLTHWLPLCVRLESPTQVPADELRRIARAMLEDASAVWCGVACELAVVVRHTYGTVPTHLVERLQVTKSDDRKALERVVRKLGKGARLGTYGIGLDGYLAKLETREEADRFVRSRLTLDELRLVRVMWDYKTWGNYDDVHNHYHTVYADADHYVASVGAVGVASFEWRAVRDTLPADVLETFEVLAAGWVGTPAELLDAARALEVVAC